MTTDPTAAAREKIAAARQSLMLARAALDDALAALDTIGPAASTAADPSPTPGNDALARARAAAWRRRGRLVPVDPAAGIPARDPAVDGPIPYQLAETQYGRRPRGKDARR